MSLHAQDFHFSGFLKYHLVEFKFESILVGKGINSYFFLKIQILIMHYAYNPQGYLAVFSPKNYDHFLWYLQFKFE
jgi:hypothetical protein